MISTQALIEKFQYALDNKWGYIWGTAGIKWTKERQEALEKTTDENRAMGRKYGSKWIGHYVADCSGMFVWAFKAFGLGMSHISSNIYKSYCTSNKGQLTEALKKTIRPGSAVFTGQTAGNHPHVGLYIGNGYVIEAKGTINGVIRSELSEKKWTFYGELKNVEYDGDSPVPVPGTHPTLRLGDKGPDVSEMQILLMASGESLPRYGADGDFGNETLAAVRSFQRKHGLTTDGICGPKTWEALEAAVKVPDEKLYSVTIPHLDKTQAEALMTNYPGATCSEE